MRKFKVGDVVERTHIPGSRFTITEIGETKNPTSGAIGYWIKHEATGGAIHYEWAYRRVPAPPPDLPATCAGAEEYEEIMRGQEVFGSAT